MESPSINLTQLQRRLKVLLSGWKSKQFPCDAVCTLVGSTDNILYSKSTALQTWLFGYELSDTLVVFSPDFMTIIASKKKLAFLQPLEGLTEVKVKLVLRSKESNADGFQGIFSQIKGTGAGKTIGIMGKDRFEGDFVTEWQEALSSSSLTTVDASVQLAYLMAPKDSAEIENMRKSSAHSATVFSKYFKAEVLKIVDREKRVKHSVLAGSVEKALRENKQLLNGLDSADVDICYSPIIQSGGNYSLKFSLVSDDKIMQYDTILCLMGARYRSYCSNVVRTMMVQPSEEQQENYKLLLDAEDELQTVLKDGARLCDVYNHTLNFISSKKPSLGDRLTKTMGFATGIEFKEGSLTISPKHQAVVKSGMVFNLAIGFTDIASDDDKYSLFVGDTVLVKADEPAEVLTNAKKQVKNIAIFLETDAAEDNSKAEEDFPVMDNQTVLESRTRHELTAEEKRKGRQRELGDQLNETARRRLLEKDGPANGSKSSKSIAVAYRHASLLPRHADIQDLRVFVDTKHEAIILPMFGQSAVFHISMLKNCSKTEHGDFTYLRLNLFCPGNTVGRAEGATFPNPAATFIKELVFKASNARNPTSQTVPATNLATAFRLIKEAQKRFKTREAERKEMEGVVAQADLVISQNRNVPRLKDLFVKPSLGAGQHRTQGSLQAHVNGFRYQPYKGSHVDILYNNVKHAIFQPSKGEMIVLMHFHLKHAILIQKKKYLDIQFFAEVGEVVTDLGRRQNMHDRDDLEAEQAEREMRHRVETAFKSFMEKVQQFSNLEFDHTFRDLGFYGVPQRSSVFLQPTTYCLVHLVESPVTVITLSELELAHFERVSFQMKNFDAVFVFKDYKRKVFMINSIPMTSLDSIKEWLTTSDIKYTEGIQSLNWSKIMKTISDDPESFFEGGGWSFLDPDDSEDDDGDEDGESDEYRPSSSGEGSEEGESSDENYSDEPSESDEEDELDSDESSGKDWSDLEEEAMEDDKERDFDDGAEEPARKRKSSSASGSAAKRRR